MMKYFYNIAKYVRKLILYRILRLQTHGVRVILRDNEKILLIKHPYDDFWVFPGGGIKRGEDPEAAAIREVSEEAGYLVTSEIKKLGEYINKSGGKNDIVTIFVTDKFTQSNTQKRLIDKIEIQKCEWFEISNLPKISDATKKRIDELTSNKYENKIRNWN